jgi:pimeloyl-ACP methyl ester carboxylesterase
MHGGDASSPSISTLDLDGVALAVRCHGFGPPVLCLHATGHGARDFDRLAARMGGAFEFIALDWPGHGDSGPDREPASAARYAEILAAAIDALHLDTFLILGNSIGGAAAITYAAAHPHRISGLVLCDTGGLVAVNWIVRLLSRRLQRRFERGAAGDPAFPRWFTRYYRRILPEAAAAWRREEIVAAAHRTAPGLAEAWASFAQPEADIRHLVPRLTMPVLYAWGRRDNTLRWSWVKKAALTAPHATVALFDAGHSAFLEQPEAFDTAFAAFAREIVSQPEIRHRS